MVATGSNATPRPVAQTPSGAGAAATPATAPRGSVDGALPLRIPFRAEKQGKSPKVPGRADGTRGKGRGVGNAATAASALSSTQDNTVRFADVMRRLAVQGTVQPVGGEGTAQHWTATIGLVVTGGLGMADVHGRPAAKDVTAAANCDHAQVSVVTASDVHFSRGQTIEVLEQVLLAVRQDVIDRPSPPDAGGRCRPRVLTEKPKVKRVYPSPSDVQFCGGGSSLPGLSKNVASSSGRLGEVNVLLKQANHLRAFLWLFSHLEIPLHKCPLGAPGFGSGGRTLGPLPDSLHLLMSEPYFVLQRLDALLDAVASEFLVQIILVDAQRRGRRTARRSQARLHRAAGYLAAFVKE